MKTKRIFLAALFAAGLFNFSSIAKDTNTSSALELAHKLNQAFIAVVDQVSPAVVVVEVTMKESTNDLDNLDNSFWDLFPPEFRRRFEQQQQQQQPRGRRGQQPRMRRAPREIGRGSGIVITEDGYILTNNHVVEDADTINVRFKDSRAFKATVKGRDPQSDLAVLKIDAKGLVPAKLGDSSATHVGEFAIAVGAPFLLDYSVTIGHVSAKGRQVIGGEEGAGLDQDFIQTDASINPGNSGGPLVNLYGEVIGINSMIRGLNTGIGFAVPSNLAKQVIPHLIKEGKFVRAYIGVQIQDLRNFQDYKSQVPGLDDGVVINMIAPDGPAGKSDLKPGDVVVAVDGKPVKTSRELKEEIAYKKVGDTITLDVVRPVPGNKTRNLKIKVKTEAFPTETENASNNNSENPNAEPANFGLTLRPLTKELADQIGIDFTPGLVVTAVDPDSPADDRDIQPGDVITEINRTPVTNMKQFRDALGAANVTKGVIVNFKSKGASRFTVLKQE